MKSLPIPFALVLITFGLMGTGPGKTPGFGCQAGGSGNQDRVSLLRPASTGGRDIITARTTITIITAGEDLVQSCSGDGKIVLLRRPSLDR